MGRCAGAAVEISVKPIGKRLARTVRHAVNVMPHWYSGPILGTRRRAFTVPRDRSDAAHLKLRCYFLVGAGDGGGGTFEAPCGAGVGGGFTSCNSTSKIRVEFGPMSGPIARSPYARVEGMNN